MRGKPIVAYLAAVGFLALFLSAGSWQLRRAAEKRALFAAWAEVEQLPVEPFAVARQRPVARDRLLRTEVRGRYLQGRNVLLDNQQRDGQIGVQVYTPFQIADSDELLLIARGFIPVPRDRSQFPDPAVAAGEQTVRGLLSAPPAAGLRLAAAATDTQSWPSVQTALDPMALSAQLKATVLPQVLLLDPAAAEGFVRDWRPRTLSVEQHLGYAVQWFGLAVTVLVVTVLLSIRSWRRRRRQARG